MQARAFCAAREKGGQCKEFLQLVSQNDTNWRNCDIGKAQKIYRRFCRHFAAVKPAIFWGFVWDVGVRLPICARRVSSLLPQYMSIACFTKSAVPAPACAVDLPAEAFVAGVHLPQSLQDLPGAGIKVLGDVVLQRADLFLHRRVGRRKMLLRPSAATAPSAAPKPPGSPRAFCFLLVFRYAGVEPHFAFASALYWSNSRVSNAVKSMVSTPFSWICRAKEISRSMCCRCHSRSRICCVRASCGSKWGSSRMALISLSGTAVREKSRMLCKRQSAASSYSR